MNNLNADAVDAEIEATKRELTDIMNVDSPLRDRVRGEMGMDGIQRAVHAIIRLQTRLHALKATAAMAEAASADEWARLDAASSYEVARARITEVLKVLPFRDNAERLTFGPIGLIADALITAGLIRDTPGDMPILSGEELRVASEKVDEWLAEDPEQALRAHIADLLTDVDHFDGCHTMVEGDGTCTCLAGRLQRAIDAGRVTEPRQDGAA